MWEPKTGPVSQMHSVRYKSSEYLLGSMDTKGEYTPAFFDYQTYLTWNLAPNGICHSLGYVSRNSYQFQPESRSTNFGTMTSAKNFTVYFDGQEEDLFQTYFGNLSLKFTPVKIWNCNFCHHPTIHKSMRRMTYRASIGSVMWMAAALCR